MKKLFTMIFALCISLGAWATVSERDGGDNTTHIVTSENPGEIAGAISTILIDQNGLYPTWRSILKIEGPINIDDLNAISTNSTFGSQMGSNTVFRLDLSDAILNGLSSIPARADIVGICMPVGSEMISTTGTSVSYSYSYSSNPKKVTIYSLKNGGLDAAMTNITQLGWDVAVEYSGTFEQSEVDKWEDDTSKHSTFTEKIIVVPACEVVGGSVADQVQAYATANGKDVGEITSLKITTNNLTVADIDWMAVHMTSLITLDISGVGLAEGANLNSLSTLKGLKVSSTFDDSSVSIADLDYIYTVGVSKVKILNAGAMETAIADNSDDAAAATSVTVTGTLNDDDLAALTAFEAVTLLNLSGITVESSSSITNLDAKGTAAILLPSTVTEAELGSLQAQTVIENNNTVQKYHCLAYFEDVTNLNIYAFDGAVGRLGTFVNPGVTAITFIPRYDTNGVFYSTDNEHGFIGRSTAEMNLFRAELKNLPAISMDLSILNQKYMSADFSGDVLSPYTHYLTLFGNVNPNSSGDPYIADYDFTNENSTSIKYPSTVWVVSTFKDDEAFVLDENGNKILISGSEEGGDAVYQRTGAATNVHYGGSRFLAATEPTNLVYVRDHSMVTAAEDEEVPSSLLEGAKDYFHGDQLYATRQIFMGDLNENEIAAINNDIHGDYFDFMYGANFTETTTTVGEGENAKALESIVELNNDNVKYILLPENHEYNINATSADVCSFSNCAHLLCVGAYNSTDKSLTAWASQNLDGNGVQIPSLYVVTGMINKNTSIENVTLSGYYCRRDVKVLSSVSDNSGLIGATIKTADLTNAVFAPNSEMVLTMYHADENHPGASWGSLTSILLPTSSSQKVLPAYCLNNTASLTSLCIPSNYETIGEYALYGCGATHIYTTAFEGDDFRDDVNVYDHGEFTITLSSNIKHIETGAFCTGNKKWTDVYSLAKDAPTCAADAFNSMNTYANNTYAGLDAHPVERANYKKDANQLMTVLHYPVTCSETEAKQYTDIKRKYSLIDETGAYDGEGNLMRWPNQSEFMRSYNQAVAGLTWDTWSDARVPVGQPTANELFDSGLYGASYAYQGTTYVTTAETSDDYHISTGWNGQVLETYTPSFTIDNDNVYDYNNYMGWHQFVLCQSVSVDRIVPKDPTTYVQGDWYTLCLPYDLTREQVLSLIGIPANEDVTYAAAKGYQASDGSWFPQVYTLTGVTRKYPTITLTFSQELMRRLEKGKGDVTFNDAESTTADSPATYKTAYDYSEEETNGQTTAGSNKIYLKGGFPYLVRPILPAGTTIDGTLGQYMLKVGSFDKTNLGHQATVTKGDGTANGKIAAPIVNQKFIARNGTEKIDFKVDEETTSKYYYYFVGTYTEEMIPAYAYHMTNNAWYRTVDESKTWQPFTAIIGGKCTDEGAVYETDNPNSNGTDGLTTYYVSLKNQDDNFVTAGQHNIQYLITFEDEEGEGEVVAIDKIDGRDINNAISAEGNVYNMTGQFVGNSLNGLAKGVYLVNGKKVLVK